MSRREFRCRQIADWLERQREDDLDPRGHARLRAHLETCPPCRREREATERLPLFAGLTGGPAPAGVRNYILGGVRAIETRPARRGVVRALLAWEPAPALAALALVGVLVLTWATGGAGEPPASETWLREGSMTNAVAAVEEIRSPTAEVFAFSLDDAAGPTEVILIVDRSIDL